jgi:hypothetical protein
MPVVVEEAVCVSCGFVVGVALGDLPLVSRRPMLACRASGPAWTWVNSTRNLQEIPLPSRRATATPSAAI